ncbi:High-affinity branched-chain amino acid transport ATP-binding protein LivF [Nocardioides aquaticus]|uniref:High-affinity branched-chain amino acid transport ATP-binding protein LivF n=2 Tax=Actinomycetes TaxID=1760 RepID=A0ABX8EC35_9ACTN|nr:ATP-binding cassette domain-containing protein [Nocardioides aquaticus]QVT77794.1 High-affinity branched-chain amino acid transport ATP-binding protein LivF [Nocardioides aquaticus]
MTAVVISGLIVGLLYAIAGLGFVVIYRTSKVLNFAMGGLGAVVAYVASDLIDLGLPYPVVVLLGLLVGGLLGALLELAIARPLRDRPHLTVALATLGALLILEGLVGLRYGFAPQSLAPAFDRGVGLDVGPISISTNQLFVAGMGLVATVVLFAIVMRTRLGLGMRAVSSGPLTAQLLGVDVGRVRMSAWILGGVYGGLAALLVTPLTYLSPGSFTIFLLTAFAAVVLGGFTSVIGVVIGALVFGVATNLLLTYLDSSLISTYTFLGVALVLVLRPHGIFGRIERQVPEPSIPSRRRAPARRGARASVGRPGSTDGAAPAGPVAVPARLRLAGWAVLLVVLLVMPFVTDDRRLFLLATAFAMFVGVLGLNVLAGFSGQVSLGQSAFLAIGAYTAAVAVDRGLPPLVGVALALVVGGGAGLLLGLPATRLSGIYLTLLTLIFAFALPELIVYLKDVTNGASGLPLTPPEFLFVPANMYWFMLAAACAVGAGVMVLAGTRTGRAWRAVRDSEDGARSLGLKPAGVKLGAFTLGSALAALGGALGGLLVGFVGPDSYGVFVSIYALLAVVLGGSGSVFGSLLGALFITVVPDVTGGSGIPQNLLFGIALLLVLFLAPRGLAGLLERATLAALGFRERRAARAHGLEIGPERETVADPVLETPSSSDRQGSEALLRLVGVSAGYGVEPVLRELDLTVGKGEIVALLGANGAGKSTVLRTISGVIPADSGDLSWEGEPLSGWPRHQAAASARRGIGHIPEGRGIFPDLTVKENLDLGSFAAPSRSVSPEDLERVLGYFPILGDRLGQLAGTLSGGEQQMLAIARALLSRPRLLMLDEPSLGLAPLISQQVFNMMRTIADSGVSILLVEQNARASLALADRAYVLSRGRVVLSGPADEVAANPSLTGSYLEVG